jgi:hypothetical protein
MAVRVLLYGGGKQDLDLGPTGALLFFIIKNQFFMPVHLSNRHHKNASLVSVNSSQYQK